MDIGNDSNISLGRVDRRDRNERKRADGWVHIVDAALCGLCDLGVATQDVPADVGADFFASNSIQVFDVGAMFGRHATTLSPHARCVGCQAQTSG
jgi:hypothetical protein